MKNVRLAPLLTLVAMSTAVATDAPYFGKWKLNSSKSQLSSVVAIEKLPSGEFRFDEVGFVYNFRPDGKEYPTPDGGTASWKALSADKWEVTSRANGKVNATITLTLNGDTLSSMAMIPQPDGKDIMQTSTSKRMSGGPGLPGKWKGTQVDAGSLWLELTPNGPDGVTVKAPNSMCAAKFDGKPYPMTGSGDGPKQTMVFRKTGPASFEATTFLDGKPFFKDVYVASADGKTLTDSGTPATKKEPIKAVYDRQ
jgi:hypothetical protein